MRLTYERLSTMSKHQLINTCLRLQEKVDVRNDIIGKLLSVPPGDEQPTNQPSSEFPQSEDTGAMHSEG